MLMKTLTSYIPIKLFVSVCVHVFQIKNDGRFILIMTKVTTIIVHFRTIKYTQNVFLKKQGIDLNPEPYEE